MRTDNKTGHSGFVLSVCLQGGTHRRVSIATSKQRALVAALAANPLPRFLAGESLEEPLEIWRPDDQSESACVALAARHSSSSDSCPPSGSGAFSGAVHVVGEPAAMSTRATPR
jgi:hypothetical protein